MWHRPIAGHPSSPIKLRLLQQSHEGLEKAGKFASQVMQTAGWKCSSFLGGMPSAAQLGHMPTIPPSCAGQSLQQVQEEQHG